MNYESMSDFEINKAVASVNGLHWSLSPSKSENGKWVYSDNYGEVCERNSRHEAVDLPDYCNNPSDAWPIINDNWNALNSNMPRSYTSYWEFFIDMCGGNKLRAAMIVFLMMNEIK